MIKSNAKYAIYDMCLNTQERNIVDQKLWNLSKNLNKLVIKSAEHLSWLFNLQRIERWAEEFRNSGRSGFGKEPDSYYLYLLLYVIYLLKEEVSVGEIPPLAVTLPYNSERIRAQKGVFTVFPQYQNDTKLQNAAKMGVHLDAMQNMTPINHCLHRIIKNYIGSDIARNLYDIIKKFKRGGNKGGFIENREYIGNKEIQLSKLEHKEKNWGFFENINISESDINKYSEFDLRKELEKKFDELFGPID